MKKLIRITGVLATSFVVILAIAFFFRTEILLKLIEIRTARSYNVTENVEIAWETGPAPAEFSGDERPPNIILILADDLGWNDLTVNGGGVAGGTVPTPNIDAIAHEGAFFSNGYSGNGTCAPSRASIMAGRYSTRFGFEFTPTPNGMGKTLAMISNKNSGPPTHVPENSSEPLEYEDMGMPTQEITLAEVLAERGYHTAHIGKWHLGRNNGMAPEDQGFKESLLMASGLYLKEDDPRVVNSKQDFDPIDQFLWRALTWAASFNGGEPFEPDGYLTDYYTQEAVKVIEANKDRPFFLYLAHWAPHTPLQALKEDYDALSHIESHRERVYAAMIRSLDRGVGEVTDALKENGLDDNTIVIFTSDNGGAGYIGIPQVNDPYRGWKITFFEGGIHVPYFIKWPEKIAPGTRIDHNVHHFDIYATAAEAAGAQVPTDRKMDGVSLLPFITETNAELPQAAPHDILFWRQGHYMVAKTEKWKLQKTDRPKKLWLFDMETDPTEQINVADQNPDVVEALLARMDEHNGEQLPPAWPAQLEAGIRIDKTPDQPYEDDEEYISWPN